MSDGFLNEDQVRNRNADQPWKKSERDCMIDTYLAGGNGAHPNTIARALGRNPKAIRRRLEEYAYNEDGVVDRYQPFRRVSRKGKRWTQNELTLVEAHRKKKIPLATTARFLQREVEELSGAVAQEVAETKQQKPIASTLDLIWAHRYIYLVYKTPVISDQAYDALVQEECEYGGGAGQFQTIKDSRGWPEHIKSLALYLTLKGKHEKMVGD